MEMSQGAPLISSDPTTKGFDLSAGTNWIYPLNYQFREYQYTIAKNALFSNTLVCLPTGLGKTLIAAVVMYNFWRWYPRGKIVFLAPTKPLVAQQISACQDIMGIPSVDTIELTGMINPKNRQIAWFTKRVIFATPQVFQNDLEKNIISGELVRCVVVDEAHKALGKHAYCESLRLLQNQNACFRVLALSATPGSRIEDVCQVIKSLFISNLELRDETSPDIIPYLNKRHMDIILVPLGDDLARFKDKYVSIMDRYVRILVQYNIIKGDASTITKGRVFYLYKDFQSKPNKPANYGQIMKTISRCMSLYHAYELLIRHGLRAFANFCQIHSADVWMTDEPALQNLIDEIQSFLGPFPDIRPLPDGSVEEIPKNLVLGHTKFHKLKKLLLDHFEKFAAKNEETKAIVFVEYRDSVNEVYVSLLQLQPIIRPKMFVGQAGQKRKQQMQAMQAFRNNEANVLISTSVGEEGLDVGEVDLIVCFDISQSSPIRLVQRMGRTGRRRDGRIVMLVTDGKEHQALKSTIARRDTLNQKVLHSSNVVSVLYEESPRMIPPDLNPECSKMHLVLQPKTPAEKGKRKRKEKENDPQKENKKKATVSKNTAVLSGEFEKARSGQSSIMKFLKKPTTSKVYNEASTDVSQSSQSHHPPSTQLLLSDSMKLLTSDTAAVEFLTLCAIKASKLDGVQNELNRMDEIYLATSPIDDADYFFDYPIPDLDILNCLVSLEERKKCSSPEDVQDFESDLIDNDVYMLEHNQPNVVEYRDTNNSSAVGQFDYEDLFNDSCESDEIVYLNNDQIVTSENNFKELPADQEPWKSQINDGSNKVKERLLQTEEDNSYAALLKDNTNNSPAVGQFDYEDLFNDSCESDEIECLNNDCIVTSENNFKALPADPDLCKSQTNDRSNNVKERLLQTEEDNSHTALLDDFFDTSSIANLCSLDQASDTNKQRYGEGINILKKGYFENISDQSSDSDVPTSQGELDSKINMRTQRFSSANYATSQRQNEMDSEKSIYKPSTNSGDNAVTGDQNRIYPLTNKTSESQRAAFTEIMSKISKPSCIFSAPTQSVKVNIDESTSSQFFTSEHNNGVASRIGSHSKTKAQDSVVKPVNSITNENRNKFSAESVNEDDDVIFVGEVNANTSDNKSRKHFIDEQLIEDDDILFEKEVSFKERSKVNESDADCSKSTITQILELIESSTSNRLNLSKISKNPQNQSHFNKSKVVNTAGTARSETAISSHHETILKDKPNSKDTFVSCYFNQEKHNPKQLDVSLKSEEPSEADLNLSEIKWEDDFETETKNADCDKVSARLDQQLNSDSRRLITDRHETSLLIKKEESLNTNSDGCGTFSESNIRVENFSPPKTMDFDVGDYEWDSDFENPANPVESLKQFSKLSNTSSPKNLKDVKASGSASKKLSPQFRKSDALSSFLAPVKKQLSTKKSNVFKPSTSRDHSSEDSDFDANFYQKLDGKSNIGKDHRPNTNYVLTTNRNFTHSKKFEFSGYGKENTEPNLGFLDFSEFSANRKERDVRKVTSFRRAAATERQKTVSLDRYRSKRKKFHDQNRRKSEFLDYEAEVSNSETSRGSSGEDDDIEGFISHTQEVSETVDMQGHYLQSIKDVYETGAFHFKTPRNNVPDDEVFSQPMSERENSSYLHDSFCVSGGEDDIFTETHEDTFMEFTDRASKSKKRKHSKNGRTSVAKKRKLVENSSDNSNSSEDETEKLRKQILDESMNLKCKKN